MRDTCPAHVTYPNNIWLSVHVMKFLLFSRFTIYSRQVISLALEARYLGQLDSQHLYPLGSPAGPAIPPGTGCSF
jgi:hypothetical protein